MFLFDAVKEEDINKFSLPVKKLYCELKILLETINEDKLNKKRSGVKIKKLGKLWFLGVYIDANDTAIPTVGVEMTDKNCCVWMDDPHNIECQRTPDISTDFIQDIIAAVRNCLSGVTVVAEYNGKGKLLKRTAYHGIDTENVKEKRIGMTMYGGFALFHRKRTVKKITFRYTE